MTARDNPARRPPERVRRRTWALIVAGLVVAASLVGLLVMLRRRPAATAAGPPAPGRISASGERTIQRTLDGTHLPAGHIAAWEIGSQPPDPTQPPPRPPVEPPNPATHRPPMDNPGGVNGDRPERPVPEIQ